MSRPRKILTLAALVIAVVTGSSIVGANVAHAGFVDAWGNYHVTCQLVMGPYGWFRDCN